MQFHPFVLGAMLIVAVGTAVYTYWSQNSNNQQQSYQTHGSRRRNDDFRRHSGSRRSNNSSRTSISYDDDKSSLPSSSDEEKRRRKRIETCSICLALVTYNELELSCGHTFHKHCIGSWLNREKTCPNCRMVL